MSTLTKEQQLVGLKEAYTNLPSISDIAARGEGAMVWIGRAKVLLQGTGESVSSDIITIQNYYNNDNAFFRDKVEPAHLDIKQALTNAIVSLDMEVGSQTVVAEPGNVFDYFDGTRKIIESAQSEIFLVDPWVDAGIVSDYFKVVGSTIKIRILTSNKLRGLDSIKPAAEKLHQQYGVSIEIRSVDTNDHLHDRFWIIDGTHGFQSSCSVKDGARKAAAVILEIRDAFDATQQTYESFWINGTIQLDF